MCIKNIFINRRNYKIVWICDSTYIISNAIVNNGNSCILEKYGEYTMFVNVCMKLYAEQ